MRVRTESAERQLQAEKSDNDIDSIHGVNLVTAFVNGKSNDPVIIDFDFDLNEVDSDSGRDSDFDYDEKQMKAFIDKCASRLEINARVVYDWSGNQLKSVDDIPKFNSFINISNHIELTPVWVSKGEGFDPYGPLRYVTKFIEFEKQLLRDLSDENSKQLKSFKNYTKREFQNLNINEYMGDDIKQIKRLLSYLTNLKENLYDLDHKYESNRSNILMQHIKEVSTHDKIFGGLASKGLKLDIYMNGQDTNKQRLFFNCKDSMNEKNRKSIGVKLLLDEINRVLQNHRSQGVRFTRIFDENGVEKVRLEQFTRDEKIWVSAGENWKSPSIKTLNMQFYTLSAYYKIPEVEAIGFSADSLQIGKVKDYKRSTFWTGLDRHEYAEFVNNGKCEIGHGVNSMSKNVHINEIHCVLQCKSNENLIMCPQLDFGEKIYLKNKEVEKKDFDKKQPQQFSIQDNAWLKNQFQLWSFHRNGIICNNYFPQLCLAIDSTVEFRVEIELGVVNKIEHVVYSGVAVRLKLRQANEPSQLWKLNSFGQIYNQQSGARYVLTYLSDLKEKLDESRQKAYLKDYKLTCTNEKILDKWNIFNVQLILLDKIGYKSALTNKLASSQRWAIKQESTLNIGQWRHSELATPEWHKQAYSWPVDKNEELIDDFEWPVVGFLIPKAPPLKTVLHSKFFDYPRLELRVLKNGEVYEGNGVSIMTPEVKHLMKEYKNCTNISLKQLEFNWFLDNCTSTLNLPFVARRLFDQNGNEYSDLRSFKNLKIEDLKFYVTSGEAWIDPRLCIEELDTKTKLLKLIDDYKKLFHFCCLKSCKSCDLVVETSNLLDEGSPLIISPCILNKDQRKRLDKGESIQAIIEHIEPQNEEYLAQEKK